MSIRPVDLQLMVHKTQDVKSHNDVARNQVSQQQFAEKFLKEANEKEHSVVNTSKSEGGNVNKDGKGDSEYKKQDSKKDSKKVEKKDSKQDQGMFDITI